MANQQNTIDISGIGGRLAEHITHLADITQSINDQTSSYILRNMEPRMRQGLVRVAVIGVTSTGKSTAINALANTLALPENPSVSTPIPVWIGYQKEEGSSATIYQKANGGMQTLTCSLPDFKRRYCYNIEDILKKDRTRYDNVAFGAVNTKSPLLEKGIVLIDTLGISATSVDSRKTIRVLKEGVDAVVFISKNSNLNMAEKRFIYQYVLGCKDVNQKDKESLGEDGVCAVRPENLFFVHNNWGSVSQVAFEESIRVLYEDSGLDMEDEDIDELVENNVFFINAYKARLGSLGVYPYVACAPEGSNDAALAGMKKREEMEKNTLAAGDAARMYAESGIQPLADAIRKKGEQLCRGNNSAPVRRINELLEVVDGVISASDDRLKDINITIGELNSKKTEFARIEAANKTDRSNAAKAVTRLRGEYEESFKKLLEAIAPDIAGACGEIVAAMSMPEGFEEDYKAYRRMDSEAKENYLRSLLPERIEEITRCCTEKILEALDNSHAKNFKTPFAVMAEVEKVMSAQEILLNGYIESLKKLGAERLGAAMPQRIVVNKLCEELKRDLEERIKAIIAEACMLRGDEFQASMQQYVKKCRQSFFQRILGGVLPGSAQNQWDKIIMELFVPLIAVIVAGMKEDAVNSIFKKTEAAFNETLMGISDSHARLFVSVDMAIAELEKQGGQFAAWQQKEKKAAAELARECGRIKDDIQSMKYQLIHG